MNTSLGNRGYTILKEELNSKELYSLRADLTVKPFVSQDYGAQAVPFPVYCESKRKLYLPRYFGLKRFGSPTINKINEGEKVTMEFPLKLKPKQEPIAEAFLKVANETGGGIISVPCGYGKTVIGLYLASKLGVKTLVVVHKEFLVNQWTERIRQFLPYARIGRLQGNKIYVDGYDIVIGMLQSISMKEYPEDLFNDFGFVIYDECHHLGAETFSRALLKTVCKYTLGLSATPTRADGLTKVFQWHLGDMVYKINKRDEEHVDVKMIKYQPQLLHSKITGSKFKKYGASFPALDEEDLEEQATCSHFNLDVDEECVEGYNKIILNYNKKPNMPRMINNICSYLPRTLKIVSEAIECLKDGRKLLILSDRREHLKVLKGEFDKTEYSSGFYLGGMKEKDLEITEGKRVILGTFSMASEGFDCRYPLDTIILASPKSNIEQAVGRILRQEAKDRKFIPLVIDILDEFSSFSGQCFKRSKFYKKNKYNIDVFNMQGQSVSSPYKKVEKKTKKKTLEEALSDFLPSSE
jgi:superfamily II DNA or RNA helicase